MGKSVRLLIQTKTQVQSLYGQGKKAIEIYMKSKKNDKLTWTATSKLKGLIDVGQTQRLFLCYSKAIGPFGILWTPNELVEFQPLFDSTMLLG